MSDVGASRGVIRADRVRRVDQPALVDCQEGRDSSNAMTVVPIMDGEELAGIEVRCACGSSVWIECLYAEDR